MKTVLVPLLVLAAGALQATTITFRFEGFTPDPYSVFGRSVIDPSNGQRVSLDPMDGGRFRMTRLGGTWTGHFDSGNTFYTFCIEPREFVSQGSTYTYDIAPLSSGTTNIGGMGTHKADLLAELFGRYFPTLSAPMTRLQAGAFQVAIWEIVREDSGTLNVYGGDIYFWPGSSESPAGVVALAQMYVQSLNGTGPRALNLAALTRVGAQDLLIQYLDEGNAQLNPEPGTFVLLGGACIGIYLLGRRRRRAGA